MKYELRAVESLSPEEIHILIDRGAHDIYLGRTERHDWYKAVESFYRCRYGDGVGYVDEETIRLRAEELHKKRLENEWLECRGLAARQFRHDGNESPSEEAIVDAAAAIAENRRKGWEVYDWLTAEKKIHQMVARYKIDGRGILFPVGLN